MKTILFLDETLKTPAIFHIMNEIIAHEGFKLIAAFDAADLASKAAEHKPDILLLKTTTDTLQILKSNNGRFPSVVLLPPKSSAGYAQKMKDAGATDVINMDQASILQVIDKVKELLY